MIYTLIDNGSAITVIEAELENDLQLIRHFKPLNIQWADRTIKTVSNSRFVTLEIGGLHENNSFTISAHTINDLNLPAQTVTKQFLEIAKIPPKTIEPCYNANPKILIGLDNTRLSHPIRATRKQSVSVTLTPLGWTMDGSQKESSEVPRTLHL